MTRELSTGEPMVQYKINPWRKSTVASYSSCSLSFCCREVHGTFLPPPGIRARHAVLHHFSVAHRRAEAPAIVSHFQQKPFKSRRLPVRMLKQTVPRPGSEQVANGIVGLKCCVGTAWANVPCTGCFLKVSEAWGMTEWLLFSLNDEWENFESLVCFYFC